MFRNRPLAAGSVNLLIVFAVMFGLFLVLVQFLQAVLGFSALKAAAGLLPMAAVMMPLSAVAPTIAKRIGLRTTLLIGADPVRRRPVPAGDDGLRRRRLLVDPAGAARDRPSASAC